MIDYITKLYWIDPNTGKTCWRYFVYYKSRSSRTVRREYTWKDKLPWTVTEFLVFQSHCSDTVYFETTAMSPTYKKETYRRVK